MAAQGGPGGSQRLCALSKPAAAGRRPKGSGGGAGGSGLRPSGVRGTGSRDLGPALRPSRSDGRAPTGQRCARGPPRGRQSWDPAGPGRRPRTCCPTRGSVSQNPRTPGPSLTARLPLSLLRGRVSQGPRDPGTRAVSARAGLPTANLGRDLGARPCGSPAWQPLLSTSLSWERGSEHVSALREIFH